MAKIEHTFWADGIQQSLEGYKEDEFIDLFVKFVLEFGAKGNDLTQITDFEENLIKSKMLRNHNLSKKFQDMMVRFLA